MLILVPLAGLLLGVAGELGVGPALGDTGQETFTRLPDRQVREARAAVATPYRPVQARQPRTAWLRGAMAPAPRHDPALPSFAQIRDVRQKKESFFSYLLPLVQAENQRLAELRQRVSYIRDHLRWGRELAESDRAWLASLAAEFRLTEMGWDQEVFWTTLMLRVDTLPVHLVLVQAANESAWGTSRFAREGNNLFGQWCFSEGCGIVPAARPEGANYEVARFPSVSASVGSYMRNLNTGRSYRRLREIRAGMRAKGHTPDPEALATGLIHYSERGEDYVDEIRSMLRTNAPIIDDVRGRLQLTSS
jgi:Bax protein